MLGRKELDGCGVLICFFGFVVISLEVLLMLLRS